MPLPGRWYPSRELDRFKREMDDLLEHFGLSHHLPREAETGAVQPAIEAFVDNDRFVVRADLPGIDPHQLDIKAVDGLLTIKGSRQEKQESRGAQFYRREVRYGSFERTIQLPPTIKAEDLKATYRDGVLELTATLPREATPRRVKVELGRA